MIAKTRLFFQEVGIEMRKATWPWDPKERGFKKYKELTDSTAVVVVAMLMLGGYVALLDLIFNYIMGLLTR